MLAPMAGLTNWPMRMLARRFGAPLAFTEMISAAAVVRGKLQADTLNALKTHPHDRPLGIQIYGPDPDEMAEAAGSLAALEADLIDINMGCPVRKIIKNGAGAALMTDLDRAKSMVEKVRKAVSIPLTVKMRTGWDRQSLNAPELARICEGEGAEALIVHGRTRAQGFGGEVDMEAIRAVVQSVKISVVGNGGIMNRRDAIDMIENTGCAGVMVARGARGKPWVFAEIIEGPQAPDAALSPAARAEVIMTHFNWMKEILSPAKAVVEMRKHLCWYSRGMPDAVEMRRSLHDVQTPPQLIALVEKYFQDQKQI